MTSPSTRAAWRAAAAAVIATSIVFTAGLWVQQARGGWPFAATAAALAAGPAPPPAAAHPRTAVTVDGRAAEALGIRFAVARRETLMQEIRAVATVVPDEDRIAHVHARVSGWIERLDAGVTGERVRAGQPLARIFSQELLASQAEYLAARRALSATGLASAVVASGRTRLGVLGLTPADIDAIEASGEPRRLVTVVAPHGGVVLERGVTAGTSVDPSTTLFTIADLSRVWVIAEVPEADVAGLRVGSPARLEFPGAGGAPIAARVELLSPTLSERTRTLRVRFSAANRDGRLRPGLFGTAVLSAGGAPVIAVPREAVVDTGDAQHVFVAAGDRYEPRRVRLGLQLADRVEIRDGLGEGERYVASGVFLLDSESRLRGTGGTGHDHGGAAMPGTDPGAGRATPPSEPHRDHLAPAADPHAGHRE